MFRNFSFDPASRHPSEYSGRDASVSPTSTPSLMAPSSLPAPPTNALADLVQQFRDYNIATTPQDSYFGFSTPVAMMEPYDEGLGMECDDEPHYPAPPISSSSYYDHPYCIPASQPAPALRRRRQALHLDPTHARDISILLDRMIQDRDQCAICSPTSSTSGLSSYASSEAGDEPERPQSSRSFSGVPAMSSAGIKTLRYRRSAECVDTGKAVVRSIRVRKHKKRNSNGKK